MDVQVTKLDRAYQLASELDEVTKDKSKNFTEEIRRIINNLKVHWRGDDATIYINKWIDVYEKIVIYFNELNKTTNFLQNNFVNMQICRSRASKNIKVGDKSSYIDEYNPLKKIDSTEEFYYDEQLKNDYLDIEELCNAYNRFADSTDKNMSQVFSNWKIGIGRKESGNYYQKIFAYSKSLFKEITSLRDELETIINNFDKLSIQQ